MPRHDPVPIGQIANPHAWARFRAIMRWMVLLAVLCVGGALLYLRLSGAPLGPQMVIATSAGVFMTVIVGTALMSLVFLSNGSGHDDAVDDPFDER